MKFRISPGLLGLFALFCFSMKMALAQVAEVSPKKFSLNVAGHTLKIPIYYNKDIYTLNPDIDRAVIVIQGSNRNAGPYHHNMEIAANSTSAMTANTVIVAPQFLIEEDIFFHTLDAEHLYWTNGGWKSGSNSRDDATNPRPARIPSYAVLDSLLLHLADQFPNLESIIFTGHSAGGQVTQRMAATSPVADILCAGSGINTRFVVINPSSYVYMDGQRRVPGSTTEFSFPANACSEYNEWKYGLEDLYTYPERFGIDSIYNMYRRRMVTYLVGEKDNNPNSSSLDDGCEASLQGAHRLERGEIYFNYVKHFFGEIITSRHEFIPVPNEGHNSLDMFRSPEGLYAIFEKPFLPCNTVVSIRPNLANEELNIFPNPAREVLTISGAPFLKGNTPIQIYDVQGRLKISQNIEASKQINIAALNSGMYILVFQSAGKRIYKNFVVH